MFSVEIRINGSMIAHIYGHNTSTFNSDGDTLYNYELYEVNGKTGLKSGFVAHKRSDGIFELIKKICSEV